MRGSDFLKNKFERGKLNKITDVEGVRVGHFTVKSGNPKIATGLTVILPHEGCVYEERVFASFHILNGYGKPTGLVQVQELGILETPVVLTGTMNVGRVWSGVVKYVLERVPSARSINPVVFECNDTRMGESEKMVVEEWMVKEAVEKAKVDFELGCVGAGTGMVTFGYKSGIGSSSRIVGGYTIGALALPNFGSEGDLGSVVIVIATNAPLIPNQLRRIAVRSSTAIAKIGGKVRHTSGDMVFAFSSAVKIPKSSGVNIPYIPDDTGIFRDLLEAAIEVSYEALLDSLVNGCEAVGRNGKVYRRMPNDLIEKLVEEHKW